jgi:hypothetical protein
MIASMIPSRFAFVSGRILRLHPSLAIEVGLAVAYLFTCSKTFYRGWGRRLGMPTPVARQQIHPVCAFASTFRVGSRLTSHRRPPKLFDFLKPEHRGGVDFDGIPVVALAPVEIYFGKSI